MQCYPLILGPGSLMQYQLTWPLTWPRGENQVKNQFIPA